MVPPHTAEADGWHLTDFRVGYRARIRLVTDDSMTVTFAPLETGPDSGLVARDPTLERLQYSVYFPSKTVSDVKLPGCISLGGNLRAPGWNTVAVHGGRVLINDADGGPGNPKDLSCYALGPRVPPFVSLMGFATTADDAPLAPDDTPQMHGFQFA